jgi:23S rRNA (guanosine2251-2'-O)-methyltransferase
MRHRRFSAERRVSAGEGATRGAARMIAPERALYGIHAAEAALANERRVVHHAYLTGNAALRLNPLLARRRIESTACAARELDVLAGGGAVHQGVVLRVEPLEQPDLSSFLDGLGSTAACMIVMLDSATDPHNVGAVLRSAAAFGIAALIVQTRHRPPLSGALAKAASGGLEYVPVIETVNLARALEKLKEHGFHCIGFDSAAPSLFTTDALAGKRLAFAFGAEDKGLRRLVREGCDSLLRLAVPGAICSLNLSNAAAIVFFAAAQAAAK